jgi:hypothetical protein
VAQVPDSEGVSDCDLVDFSTGALENPPTRGCGKATSNLRSPDELAWKFSSDKSVSELTPSLHPTPGHAFTLSRCTVRGFAIYADYVVCGDITKALRRFKGAECPRTNDRRLPGNVARLSVETGSLRAGHPTARCLEAASHRVRPWTGLENRSYTHSLATALLSHSTDRARVRRADSATKHWPIAREPARRSP